MLFGLIDRIIEKMFRNLFDKQLKFDKNKLKKEKEISSIFTIKI